MENGISDDTLSPSHVEKRSRIRIFPALVFPESVQVKQAIVCFPHHDKMKVYEALLNTIVMTAAQRYNMSIPESVQTDNLFQLNNKEQLSAVFS